MSASRVGRRDNRTMLVAETRPTLASGDILDSQHEAGSDASKDRTRECARPMFGLLACSHVAHVAGNTAVPLQQSCHTHPYSHMPTHATPPPHAQTRNREAHSSSERRAPQAECPPGRSKDGPQKYPSSRWWDCCPAAPKDLQIMPPGRGFRPRKGHPPGQRICSKPRVHARGASGHSAQRPRWRSRLARPPAILEGTPPR